MSTHTRGWVAAACAVATLAGGMIGLTGTAHAAPPAALTGTTPQATAAAADSVTHPTRPIDGVFRSRPDLPRPSHSVARTPATSTERYFTQQRGGNALDAFSTTAYIYGGTDEPIWIGPQVANRAPRGATPILFGGQPAFAFHDSGGWTVVDSRYERLAFLPTQADSTLFTPLMVSSADGTRALVSGNRVVTADLTGQGGPTDGRVVVPVVREIELSTGKTLFTWDSWAEGPGRVPVTDSTLKPYGSEFAYLNVTGLSYDADGDILVAAHSTQAVYKISRSDGAIRWTLGGKRGDLAATPGTALPEGPVALLRDADGVLWLLDQPKGSYSCTLSALRIDEAARTVSRDASLSATIHQALSSDVAPAANLQKLGNGHIFASTLGGETAEFDAAGKEVAATYVNSDLVTPPARANWQARPTGDPDVGLDMTSPTGLSTYASWNGATDVASWRVSAGPDAAHLRPLATGARTGFETRVDATVAAGDAVVRVEALDASGAVLDTSADTPLNPITRKYGELGGATSALGRPTSLIEPWLGGFRQHFVGGDMYWRADTGTRIVPGLFARKMDERGSAAGFPTSDARPTPDGSSTYQLTTVGGMYGYGSPAPQSALLVTGPEWAKYAQMGWERGPLGYPYDEFTANPDGTGKQRFSHGAIYRIPDGLGFREVAIHGAIYRKFVDQRPWGGIPVSDELTTTDGVGRFTNFVDPANGAAWSIYWTPSAGAHFMEGIFLGKWAATGYENGIGYPTTDPTPFPQSLSAYQHFERGSLYPGNPGGQDRGALYVVKGAIRDAYARTGWERGFLYFPQTDELAAPDGYGRYNHFTFGSIYWTPATGAQSLNTHARDEWARRGWERGALGYPVGSTAKTPDGIGEYTHFEYGSIYTAVFTGPTQTIVLNAAVRGDIRAKWASLGWERGRLGYPIDDERDYLPGQRTQKFQGGSITWDGATRRTTVTYF